MSEQKRPILLIQNAGFGETPVPPDAIFQPGEMIGVGREDAPDVSITVECLAVVPARCVVEYAIADQSKPPQPRPLTLTIRKPYQETAYVLQFEDELEPRIYTQTQMLSGKQKSEPVNQD